MIAVNLDYSRKWRLVVPEVQKKPRYNTPAVSMGCCHGAFVKADRRHSMLEGAASLDSKTPLLASQAPPAPQAAQRLLPSAIVASKTQDSSFQLAVKFKGRDCFPMMAHLQMYVCTFSNGKGLAAVRETCQDLCRVASHPRAWSSGCNIQVAGSLTYLIDSRRKYAMAMTHQQTVLVELEELALFRRAYKCGFRPRSLSFTQSSLGRWPVWLPLFSGCLVDLEMNHSGTPQSIVLDENTVRLFTRLESLRGSDFACSPRNLATLISAGVASRLCYLKLDFVRDTLLHPRAVKHILDLVCDPLLFGNLRGVCVALDEPYVSYVSYDLYGTKYRDAIKMIIARIASTKTLLRLHFDVPGYAFATFRDALLESIPEGDARVAAVQIRENPGVYSSAVREFKQRFSKATIPGRLLVEESKIAVSGVQSNTNETC
jgi:hypothetical protein